MESSIPKPNTQALSWFFGEFEKKSLVLTPKYQRNPIWSIGQKCFLIDSILSGCPLPQIYINIKTSGQGGKRQTYYEIVDGQQRLRAILEFMRDEYSLIRLSSKAYPVSTSYEPHIGKRYSEISDSLQNYIWNYPIAVQELRDWDEAQIRSLFRRLNYVVEKLNKQELRHSQYFGEFVETVEKLSKLNFWDKINFFSRRDSQRMKDIEFVSELFVVVIDGPQDQQKSLDKYYADYDVIFPKKAAYVNHFTRALEAILTLKKAITNARYKKKADFYALFAAVLDLTKARSETIDLSSAINKLIELDRELELDEGEMSETARKYRSTVVEGPNKLSKRILRKEILDEILRLSI